MSDTISQPLQGPCSNNHEVEIEPVFAVMTAMTDHYVSTWEKTDELRAMKRERLMRHYGWTAETIERFRIGFDDSSVVSYLRDRGFERQEIIATGCFYVDSYNTLVSRFAGRIVFPYLDERGTTLYFTGRQTSLTPPWIRDGKDCAPKYTKTKVHVQTKDGSDDDGISPLVVNVIFSTHETPRKRKVGIIAEGIADAISAAQAGYAVRSPVTTVFKESDAEIIGELISGWDTAVLVPDMEANRSGITGAVKTAKKLIEKGRDIRIAILPHEEIQAAAQARVEELRAQRIAEGKVATDEEVGRAGDWKTDLNEFLAAPVEARAEMVKLSELRSSAKPEDTATIEQARAAGVQTIIAKRAERQDAFRILVETAAPALAVMIEGLPDAPTPNDWGTSIPEVTETIALIRNNAEREAWLDRLKAQVGGRLPVLRKMVEQEFDDEESEAENPLTPILSTLKFFRVLTGRVFTVVDAVAVPVDGEEFAAWVSNRCFETTKTVVGPTLIKDSVRAVVGVSTKLPLGTAPIRYAYDKDGGIWIDLADRNESYVHVTARTVKIEKRCPIAFYRPAGTGAMPPPELIEKPEVWTEALDDWFNFLAIGKKSRAGLFAIIMSAMRPMEQGGNGSLTTFTVGVLNGEHGCGKSTRQKFIRRLIDPREPASMKMPDSVDDLIIYCENTAVVSLDNQSMLSETMSDALCRTATGDGNVKRSLYTTRDLAVFRGSRPSFVNGITDVVVRDDLLDRAIIIHVETPEAKKTDDELEVEFQTLFPRVLGAMCFCMMEALARDVDTTVDRSIRMLQAARWAAAAEVSVGFEPGSVEQAYLAARDEAIAIASDDPFVTAVLAIAKGGFKDTMAVLSETLIEHVEERDDVSGKAMKKIPKDFPTTTPKTRSMLKRKLPALRALGLEMSRVEERTATCSKATLIVLTLKNAGPNGENVTSILNGVFEASSGNPSLDDV